MSSHGFFIKGKMLGSRQRNNPKGQGYYNEIGIDVDMQNGFGGTKQESFIIRVPNSLVDAGVMNQANALIGKLVQIPVYVKCWISNGKPGLTYYMSLNGGITEIKS
ncbi:MAG: DNA-binding protein [Aerococcus sp.]|nr:DNA-binding protein [Aerococcus sp.]